MVFRITFGPYPKSSKFFNRVFCVISERPPFVVQQVATHRTGSSGGFNLCAAGLAKLGFCFKGSTFDTFRHFWIEHGVNHKLAAFMANVEMLLAFLFPSKQQLLFGCIRFVGFLSRTD